MPHSTSVQVKSINLLNVNIKKIFTRSFITLFWDFQFFLNTGKKEEKGSGLGLLSNSSERPHTDPPPCVPGIPAISDPKGLFCIDAFAELGEVWGESRTMSPSPAQPDFSSIP